MRISHLLDVDRLNPPKNIGNSLPGAGNYNGLVLCIVRGDVNLGSGLQANVLESFVSRAKDKRLQVRFDLDGFADKVGLQMKLEGEEKQKEERKEERKEEMKKGN